MSRRVFQARVASHLPSSYVSRCPLRIAADGCSGGFRRGLPSATQRGADSDRGDAGRHWTTGQRGQADVPGRLAIDRSRRTNIRVPRRFRASEEHL